MNNIHEKPWLNEPDIENFVYQGYECLLKRNMLGCWLGYVHIPASSVWAQQQNFMLLDVHGGITYANLLPDQEDIFVLGFDCAHLGDIMPYAAEQGFFDPHASTSTYKTIDYARDALKHMVDQIHDFKKSTAMRLVNQIKEEEQLLVDQIQDSDICYNSGNNSTQQIVKNSTQQIVKNGNIVNNHVSSHKK